MLTPSIKFIPPVIAHRGASLFAPENTLSAFVKAKQLGAAWVEFDVMLAASDEILVIHDYTLDRTSNGSGKVSDLPLSYIKTLDAGSWFDKKFAEEKIPSFPEVIACLKQQKLGANVEIKALFGREEEAVKKILSDIDAHWTSEMPLPLISSFSIPTLRYVRQHSPNALIGLLIDEWFQNWEAIADELHCVSVHLSNRILNEAIVKKIKAMGKLVLSYTVNQPEEAERLFSFGVDAVFTDNLVQLLALPR